MPFLKFHYKPKNELEAGGRTAALPQPALPKITFAVNGSTQTMESMANGIEGLMTGKAVSEVRIASDIPVKGTLTVDGGEGSSYAFDTFSTEFTQKLERQRASMCWNFAV